MVPPSVNATRFIWYCTVLSDVAVVSLSVEAAPATVVAEPWTVRTEFGRR